MVVSMAATDPIQYNRGHDNELRRLFARVQALEMALRPRMGGRITYTRNRGEVFPVKVEKTAGVGGDCDTACSFVYTVRSVEWDGESGGEVYGTNMTPLKARPTGLTMFAQSGSENYGIGFYREDGDFVLWDANEYISAECCTI